MKIWYSEEGDIMIRNKDTKNTFHTVEVVFLIIITCIVSVLMGMAVSSRFIPNVGTHEDNDIMATIWKQYQYIKDNYYEEVDDKTLLNGALAGMVNALDDPFSTFIDEEDAEDFNMSLQGNYSGIGIEITNNTDGNIVVVSVFDNSPAEKAGIKVGDIITAIDGESLLGKDKSELTSYVKENKLDKFVLTVLRDREEIEISVQKEIVEIPSVSSEVYEQNGKKVGYIYFSIFSNTTAKQFEHELASLEEQEIDALIIDVRQNSGGHLTTAVDIVSLFLDQTKVIYQIELKKETTKYYSTGDVTKTYPIVVLQDGNSASASELLSAALKESYGATIIGTTSYGKGTVQQLVTVEESIEYKFTTKKWLTPNGNWIHKIGVKPDIEVELDKAYYTNPIEENDNQLQEAIRYLTK